MTEHCRVCQQLMEPWKVPGNPRFGKLETDHHLERSHYPGLCMGCWRASIELQTFLLRATSEAGGRSVMGDWATGWLKEIIADPTRYR